MKLQPDQINALSITGHGLGWIGVNGERHLRSLVVSSLGDCFEWAPRKWTDLGPADFEVLESLKIELLLVGCGQKFQHLPPAWLAPLMRLGWGLEYMDTIAACRTYNILAGEGRKVAAALIIESSP